jgi:hypothetical protein
MPNLENLKKQAKLVLRWHRERYYPVAAQIRTVLPRYRELTDTQILTASFKLSDAQELVARQAGFESWAALKAGLATMASKPEQTSQRAVIAAAEPQLFVAPAISSCRSWASPLHSSTAIRRSTGRSPGTAPSSTCAASTTQ